MCLAKIAKVIVKPIGRRNSKIGLIDGLSVLQKLGLYEKRYVEMSRRDKVSGIFEISTELECSLCSTGLGERLAPKVRDTVYSM